MLKQGIVWVNDKVSGSLDPAVYLPLFYLKKTSKCGTILVETLDNEKFKI
jgi:hypothetical protein